MPVLDGLQATRLIRSYEETGNWNAAIEAGVDINTLEDEQVCVNSTKRLPIIAVSTTTSSHHIKDKARMHNLRKLRVKWVMKFCR